MQQGYTSRFAAMPADWLEVIDIELGILPNRQRNSRRTARRIGTVIA